MAERGGFEPPGRIWGVCICHMCLFYKDLTHMDIDGQDRCSYSRSYFFRLWRVYGNIPNRNIGRHASPIRTVEE